jgi:predicted benzoate:H+ symporter BenE
VFCLIAGAVLSAMFFGPLPIVVALAGAALTAVMLASLQKTLASAC